MPKPIVMTVIGARPQFVKAAAVSTDLARRGSDAPYTEVLVHTGQHYDRAMSDVFFEDLQLREPDFNLGVGSNRPNLQLAEMFRRLDETIESVRPHAVMAYGDTNSTMAAAVVAAHRNLPFLHVEAGERIYRRSEVPEEVNRVVADELAHLCLTVTRKADRFLEREGYHPARFRFVGDTMYDIFCMGKRKVESTSTRILERFDLSPESYHLATIHRAQNTTSFAVLQEILESLDAANLPVVLPVHPRVKAMLDRESWTPQGALRLVEALGYFEFQELLLNCRKVATDSGGVTREAFFAGKPACIPMENSWWMEIVEAGWLVETGSQFRLMTEFLDTYEPPRTRPEGMFGDGQAARHTVDAVAEFLSDIGKDGLWHRQGSFDQLPATRTSVTSYDNYRSLLNGLRSADYAFLSFGEALDQAETGSSRVVALRHDVAFDPERALAMARLEHDLGLVATYFAMPACRFYNLLDPATRDIFRQILALGHHLGLHVEVSHLGANPDPLAVATFVREQGEILERVLGVRPEIVSFRRPDPAILAGEPAYGGPYGHVYEQRFRDRFFYVADSHGEWRHGHPLQSEAFAMGRPIQLVVHPFWWSETPANPHETAYQLHDRLRRADEREIARQLAVFRVGWLAEEA